MRPTEPIGRGLGVATCACLVRAVQQIGVPQSLLRGDLAGGVPAMRGNPAAFFEFYGSEILLTVRGK